ncbi:hypothetical protein, partial [Pseudoalteromonas distincta]|uniref:hypothetical protein n=1 Tax=Pseudoalteromonas distincta TaxID=77608 RepID=UPI0034E8FE28
ADTIRRYGRPEALHQIRLMSTGDGELLWFFSILEPQGAAGLLRTVPVQIYTTEPLSAKPRLLADLGTYDFQALEATSAYARASRAD